MRVKRKEGTERERERESNVLNTSLSIRMNLF